MHYSHDLIIKYHTREEIALVAGLNEDDDESQDFLANRVPCDPNRINCRRVVVKMDLSSNSSESAEAHSDFARVKH